MTIILFLLETKVVVLNPGVKKPPGYYLCTPESGRLGCVISIEKRCATCERHERREDTGEKTKFPALYIPPPGFKDPTIFRLSEYNYYRSPFVRAVLISRFILQKLIRRIFPRGQFYTKINVQNECIRRTHGVLYSQNDRFCEYPEKKNARE